MDPQTDILDAALVTWCIRTQGGTCRVILAGERLPRVHHEPSTGVMSLVASGHRWETRPGCSGCFPAPLPESVTSTPIPPETAMCTACVIRASIRGAGAVTLDAEHVLVPDNGRDGLSVCAGHWATVEEAILDNSTDDETWEALVDLARAGGL